MRWAARGRASGCWPDKRQLLLLRAAVWNDERALLAWERWRAQVTPAQVNWSDTGLLATAYRPLLRLGAEDPMLKLAGGAYRRAWYRNQLGARRLAGVVAALRAAGTEVLLLKGMALALLHYRDLGARPMEDLDLLVGPQRLEAGLATLLGRGWGIADEQTQVHGPLRYGTHVVDAGGNQLDLHAYALMQAPDDDSLWRARVPVELPGVTAAALCPADQLVHVCAHGLRWDERPTVRWAADAMTLLGSPAEPPDWDRVVERAAAWRVTVAVSEALAWLREELEAAIPEWVLRSLRAGPRLPLERAMQAVWMRPPTPLRFAAMSFDRYRRFARLAGAEERPESFAAYLRDSWGLENSRGLVVYGGRKLAGRSR